MESATEGRRFAAQGNQRGLLSWGERARESSSGEDDGAPPCRGTPLAHRIGDISEPSLNMRVYSTIIWLWGFVSGSLEELRELSMGV
jgi:hypothetical protein